MGGYELDMRESRLKPSCNKDRLLDLRLCEWIDPVIEIDQANPDRILVDALALRANRLSRVKCDVSGGDTLDGSSVLVNEIVVTEAALFQDGDGAFKGWLDGSVKYDGINHRCRFA